MSRAKCLRDLIYHPLEDTCHHFAVELVDCLGINTLIILEGFDELPDSQREEPSIFLQLILGQLLPFATILVTSRPWATGALLVKIKHRIFQHVEILGFTEENITKYVTSVFTGEGKKTASAIYKSVGGPDEVSEEAKKNIDDVMAYIDKYPQIKACMYIPLNAAIVVSIYRDSMKSKWVLPTTLTELYESLTRILLLRHLCGHSEYQICRVESFEDLPEEVYSQFLDISKIAYDGICRGGWKSISVERGPTQYSETFTSGPNRNTSTSTFRYQSVDDLYDKSQDIYDVFDIEESESDVYENIFFFFDWKSGALDNFQMDLLSLLQSGDHKSVQLIFPDIPDNFETLGLMQSVSQLFMDGKKTSHNFLHLTFQEFLAAFLISTMSSAEQLEHFQRYKDGRLRVVLRFLAGLTKLNKVTPDELRSLLGEPRVRQSDEHQTPYCNPMRPDVCVSAHHTNWLFETQNSELLQSLFHNHTASFTFTRGMVPLEYYSVGYCIAHSHSKWSLTFDGDREEEKLHMLVNGTKTGDGNYRVAVKTTSMTSENMNILVNGFSSHVEELYCLKIPDNGNSLYLPPLSTLHILELQVDNNKSAFNISCDLSFSSLEALIISSSCEGTTLGVKTYKTIGRLLSSTTSLKMFCLSLNIKSRGYSEHVSDEGMEVITKALSNNIALSLMCLDIDCKCTFTTTAIQHLLNFIARSNALQHLKIVSGTFNISVKGLTDNIDLQMKSLDIDCKCTFTTTAIQHLLNFIARSNALQHLKIVSGTINISVKGLTDNIDLPMKSLDIDCKCTFTTTATRSLVQFITRSTTLQYLKIHIDSFEDVDIFVKGLSDNIALPIKSLDIDCKCTFTTTATRSLVQFITRSTTLQFIRICHATFSAEGLIELTEAIHHCSRLQEKKLEKLTFCVECSEAVITLKHMFNEYPDMRKVIDWNEAAKISRSHKYKNTLTLCLALECSCEIFFNFTRMNINDVESDNLAQALHHNSTLKVLDLSNNNISDAGAVALAQALHHNSTLKELHLSNNNISDAGVVALAQALHHNSSLKELYLSNNNISDGGAVALAQALNHNSTFKELYLFNNSISDDGAVALAQALHHNSTLKKLSLYGNDAIGKEGTHQLVQALTVNTSITYGMRLPRRCEEYATQCTQYNTVKDRITFSTF